MNAALETRGLSMSFGGLKVTQDVDLRLERGARHALIGPNGAGKTTLLNQLTGVLRPSAGSIWLQGEDITRLRPDRRVRRGLARTWQINSLFPQLTPLEAVTHAICERDSARIGFVQRRLRGLTHRRAEIDEAYLLLRRMNLGEESLRPTRELAYGKQRLLEMALALAAAPTVLLLDEPAAGVPQDDCEELLRVLAELPRDIAVLLIEHDMSLVFRFAERITVMAGGAVLVTGTPAQIAADERVREVYLGKTHG